MATMASAKPTQNRFLRPLFSLGTQLAGVSVFLIIWQVGVMLFNVPAYFLPSPTRILEEGLKEYAKLGNHGWITTYEMLAGYFLAVTIGVPLNFSVCRQNRDSRREVAPRASHITPQILKLRLAKADHYASV